jgi:hypothetical protein
MSVPNITLSRNELHQVINKDANELSGEKRVKIHVNPPYEKKFEQVCKAYSKQSSLTTIPQIYFSLNENNKLCLETDSSPEMRLCAKNNKIFDDWDKFNINELFKNGDNFFTFTNSGVGNDRGQVTVNITFTDAVNSQRGGSRKTTRKFRKGKKKSSRKMKTKGRK